MNIYSFKLHYIIFYYSNSRFELDCVATQLVEKTYKYSKVLNSQPVTITTKINKIQNLITYLTNIGCFQSKVISSTSFKLVFGR